MIQKVYLQAFKNTGTYEDDWTEITKYVTRASIGSISSNIDNTDFDVGIIRNNSLRVVFDNSRGKFSDVDAEDTFFKYKRGDSKLKLTWSLADLPVCGLAVCGESWTTEEITVFTGLFADESAEMDLKDQRVNAMILGRESLIDRAVVPFDDLSDGMLISEAVYACLNQSIITNLLTVDADAIIPGLDQEIDTVAPLQNKTVKEALGKLLLAANSVLYILNDKIYVSSRDATPDLKYSFYGQGSEAGSENIISLNNIRSGLNRVFNYWTWKDTTLSSFDSSSVEKFGARKKEIQIECFTNSTKQQNILDALLDEFKDPKIEFDLETPINHTTVDLGLLSRVNVDYPIAYSSSEVLPVCGSVVCGHFKTPSGLWSFEFLPTTYLKITGKNLNLKEGTITFKLREI